MPRALARLQRAELLRALVQHDRAMHEMRVAPGIRQRDRDDSAPRSRRARARSRRSQRSVPVRRSIDVHGNAARQREARAVVERRRRRARCGRLGQRTRRAARQSATLRANTPTVSSVWLKTCTPANGSTSRRRLESDHAAVRRRPDHRAVGLRADRRRRRVRARPPRPSPTTSRPACARHSTDCASCPDA